MTWRPVVSPPPPGRPMMVYTQPAGSVAPTAPAGPTFPSSGLLAYYKLDGNVLDSSGNGKDGTATSITYTTGKSGSAASFTASTPSRIVLPTTVNISASFTLAAWIKPSTLVLPQAAGVIFNDWDGTHRNVTIDLDNATDKLQFQTGNGVSSQNTTLSSTATIPTSGFTFVVCSRSGTTVSLYIDNVLNATTTGSFSGGVTGFNPRIGADNISSVGWGFGGLMDGVGIWNRALTTDEINTLWNSGTGLFLT